jgi:hypothetical protein
MTLDLTDPAAMRAEAERRQRLREQGAATFHPSIAPTFGITDEATITLTKHVWPRPTDPDEAGRLEKEIEHAGDQLMRALGFEIVRFSHPGKTKQTPGIPDRRYYHRARHLAVWWEVKAEWGTQRPDQRVFQEMCEAVSETYLLGGLAVLRTWLAGRRVCAFGVDNTPLPLPIEEQVP